MSYKTDRLVNLFPAAYAAADRESLLYKLLDSIGAELMQADESVKRLLKSHWVNYAEGDALDGLGGVFGVGRRRLPDGSMEPDALFRLRLKSIVPMFTGGGTREAIIGAVRSALGLPFKLEQLALPPQYAYLIPKLESLITLIEFSPKEELLIKTTDAASPGDMTLDVPIISVNEEPPKLVWQCTRGGARRLRITRLISMAWMSAIIFPVWMMGLHYYRPCQASPINGTSKPTAHCSITRPSMFMIPSIGPYSASKCAGAVMSR
jgi:hypothetical protein